MNIDKWVSDNIDNNGHKIISPSGANTWSNCAGSMLNVAYLRKRSSNSIPSVEGTIAHGLLELCVNLDVLPKKLKKKQINKSKIKTELLVFLHSILDHEFTDKATKEYTLEQLKLIEDNIFEDKMLTVISHVAKRIAEYKKEGYKVYAELPLDLKKYLGHTQCNGTSDIVLIKGNNIIVLDLKYGRILVYPKDNNQLKLYGLGVLASFKKMPKKITLAIAQPNLHSAGWKEWRVSSKTLIAESTSIKEKGDRALRVLVDSVEGKDIPSTEFNPSDKACEWCLRKEFCSYRYEFYYKKLNKISNLSDRFILEQEQHKVSQKTLHNILKLNQGNMLTKVLKDANDVMWTIAKQGKSKKYKLVSGRNYRKWKGSETAIKTKLKELGLKETDYIKTTLKTVPQMDGIKADPEVKDKIKENTFILKGRSILVPKDDKREDLNPEPISMGNWKVKLN